MLGGGGWDREERRCSSVWDIESRLLSRLCVCSLGRHGGGGVAEGVRRAVAPSDREPFY